MAFFHPVWTDLFSLDYQRHTLEKGRIKGQKYLSSRQHIFLLQGNDAVDFIF